MYSKSCCALFLLALVACQAAPSPKIIEKSTETASKLVKEDIKLEDTGADKDRAKKSTTFCVEVRSGKEELVPCKQELPIKQTQQVLDLKTPEYKPMTIMQTASVPASVQYPVQYPVSNIMMQQPMPQLSPISLLQPPSQVVVSAQPQQQVPEPITHQHVIHVQTQPQQTSAPVSQVQSQQSAFSAPAPAPAPTPIINIIPAPASAPCEKPSVMQPQPIPPQQVHTVHVVQPTQQAPLLPKQEIKPIKMEQEKPQILPISHQGLSVLTPVARPCKTEMLLPSSPVELVYHEEEPTRLVEYVPTVQEELYECSCRSEQQKAKPYKHHVTLHPSGSKSFRSPMMTLQYNPSIGENVESPVIAQAREMEGRHHHKNQIPLHLTVQQPYPVVYTSSNNPPTYESNSYQTMTYITSPYSFSYPYETHSSYPTTNYDSSSPQSYNNVPLIAVNTGGPFQRNSQNQNSKEISADNKNIQETLSNVNGLSSNQKREVTNTRLKNDKQKKTAEELQVEKESSINQMISKTDADEISKQKEE